MILIVDLEELKKKVAKVVSNAALIAGAAFVLWIFVSWFAHGFLGLPAGAYNFFTVLINLI